MLRRQNIAALLAEFLGVAVLTTTLLSIGKSGVGYSYFLAGGVGLAAGAMALAVATVSGAHFNPAVTLGSWAVKRVTTTRALAYLVAQFLGGFVAWQTYQYLVNQPLEGTAKEFDWRLFVAEAIAGFLITFIITAAVFQGYKGLRLAAAIAGAIFAGTIVASLGSNGIGNPAIALGVRSWSVPYVVGPLVGGILGSVLYAYVISPQVVLAKTTKVKSNKK